MRVGITQEEATLLQASITTSYVRYPGLQGEVRAYVAHPDGAGPWPALIVIHEWTGLIPYVEDVARRLAREGYLALAPDLYTDDPIRESLTPEDLEGATDVGNAPDVEVAIQALRPERQDSVRRAHQWRRARTGATHVPDLQATMAYAQGRADIAPNAIGIIGFCMGGRLAGTLATTGAALAAAVVFYGPIPPLEGVPNVRCPVEGHYGEKDHVVKLPTLAKLDEAMTAAGKQFTYYVYEGAPHGFHNDTWADYAPAAAELAWDRSLQFLDRHVKG
ncbi:MAG: carboxymethylenebutenolidase [Chloroflexota bacterium]|nr:carboxymethylenebutenolidase [Chloroflexota bacterium]